MAKRRRDGQPVWPDDVCKVEVPKEVMDAAMYETYRFLFNYWVWQGDLCYLCAICYLQGAMDGAQVVNPPRRRGSRAPHERRSRG